MAGRPSKYDPNMCKQVTKLCRLGATTQEVADFFDVHRDTILEWQNTHEEFAFAMRTGKLHADVKVANALYKKATGYTIKEKIDCGKDENGEPIEKTKVTRIYPDTVACIFWLKNRQPDKWRDKQEVSVESTKPIVFAYALPDEPPTAPDSNGEVA
jgi:hypothetical protein